MRFLSVRNLRKYTADGTDETLEDIPRKEWPGSMTEISFRFEKSTSEDVEWEKLIEEEPLFACYLLAGEFAPSVPTIFFERRVRQG